MNHIIKALGLCFFIIIALGSGTTGTTLKATPGKTFEEINSQSLSGMNGRLVFIGRHPILEEIQIYETESSIREMQINKDVCQRERGNKYSECISRFSKISPDANQGVKYYFLNGISISDDQLSLLLTEDYGRERRKYWDNVKKLNKEKADAERRAFELKEKKLRIQMEQEAEQRRIQIEQDKVKRSRPVLNTD